MKRHIANIDLDTGEIFNGHDTNTRTSYRYHFEGKEWLAMSIRALQILREQQAKGATLQVFNYIIETIDKDTKQFHQSQAQVAKATNLTTRSVHSAFKHLSELRLITPLMRIGLVTIWSLNPRLGFRGSAKAQNKAVNAQRPNKPNIRLAHSRSPQ